MALVGDNLARQGMRLEIYEDGCKAIWIRPKKRPFYCRAPFVTCPARWPVVSRDKANGALLLTCSRGYAHVMVEAILHAGAEFGLRPAGERRLAQVIDLA
jgi:hypothetical protein